jgi:hypothetical protein
MTSKRNIESRIDDLSTDDESDNATTVYIYDAADADEPVCVIGGEDE